MDDPEPLVKRGSSLYHPEKFWSWWLTWREVPHPFSGIRPHGCILCALGFRDTPMHEEWDRG